MKAKFNFAPTFCPNCGSKLTWSGTIETRGEFFVGNLNMCNSCHAELSPWGKHDDEVDKLREALKTLGNKAHYGVFDNHDAQVFEYDFGWHTLDGNDSTPWDFAERKLKEISNN